MRWILFGLFCFISFNCFSVSYEPYKDIDRSLKYSEMMMHSPDFYKNGPDVKRKIIDESILLTADLQLHYLYGYIPTRYAVANKFSPSIRPIASDLYAQLNFGVLTKNYQERTSNNPIVILGDAIDVSCQWEADRFFSLMKDRLNWVLAPGNHDVTYLGATEKGKNDQKTACKTGLDNNNIFNKNDFIVSYLHALNEQGNQEKSSDKSYKDFAIWFDRSGSIIDKCEENLKDIWRNEWLSEENKNKDFFKCNLGNDNKINIPYHGWWKNRDKTDFLQDVYWYINPNDSFYSFIVQRIRVPDGRYAILLDTNNAQTKRSLAGFGVSYNPANSANMLFRQMHIVAAMMGGTLSYGRKGKPNTILHRDDHIEEHILMSHHPIDEYRWFAKAGLKLLVELGKVKDVYTAHTHKPKDSEINGRKLKLNQITLGSMIDFPLEYSILTKERKNNINTYRVDLSNYLEGEICKDREEEWKIKESNEFYYTRINSLNKSFLSKSTYKNSLLATLYYFREELNPKHKFETINGGWPFGKKSDNELIEEIDKISFKIDASVDFEQFKEELIAIDNFMNTRQVPKEREEEHSNYRSCQLHWASISKRLWYKFGFGF